MTKDDLDKMYTVIKTRWREKALDDDTYMKLLILLTHDWLTINEPEDALTVLAGVTEVYVRTRMPIQMKEDLDFAKSAQEVAQLLHDRAGISDDEPTDPKIALLVALARPANA